MLRDGIVRASGGVVVLCLIVTAAWLSDTSIAHAEPSATVIRDFPCGLSEGGGGVITTDSGRLKVLTPAGVSHILCIDGSVSPAGQRAEVYDYQSTGESCTIQTPAGTISTIRWHNVVTPSGISVQLCHSPHPAG